MAKKCVVCGLKIENDDDIVPYKSRYAHKKCFQSTIKIATTEKKKELSEKTITRKRKSIKPSIEMIKDAVNEEEFKLKKDFFDYLKIVSGIDNLSAKVYVLAEDYIKKYNFTYLGMKQALEYYFQLCKNKPIGDCIGIIPYIYDEANKYFEDIERVELENKNRDLQNMYKEKTIKISTIRKKKVRLLDIENIGLERI